MPWFQLYLHRQPIKPVISDCEKCMQATTQQNRQGRGCGYEPRPAGLRVMPWQPPLNKLGYKHALPTICAGYTTRLPEVTEIARAHTHWQKGELVSFLGGEQPTELVKGYLEVLDAELSAVEAWAKTPIEQGGGRE